MYKPIFQKREVLVFRQFQRKSYSLFACLGREVVISVLSVATLSSSKAASISDETWRVDSTKATKEVWLGDVGVTGSRAPLAQSQAARMVTVLTRDDIQAAPVQSVNDLLKYAVGVDVRQRGALGSQADISIRGGTQEQITVLLNGINICDPQTGHNVMDLPVDLSEIVRIEVLEGPAGRTYGTSSLVGAVNIVTHPARESSADVTLEGGSYGTLKVSGRANKKSGAWNNQLSGSYMRSDGYSRSQAGGLNTDYSGSKAFYQGEYNDEWVHLSWHAGIADKGWGSSTFYASPKWQADDQYEHTTKLYTAVQAETKQGRLHFRPSIYWNQNRDRYEGYRGQADKMKYNYNRCDVYGACLNSYFDWIAGRTAFGAELRNEDLVSGNLGEPLFQTHHIGGTDRDYTLGLNRTNMSAHLEHNVLLERLTVSAGFVAMKSTQSSMNWQLYPGIDASYRLGSRWKLFASYNSSLRLPSFTEMYYKLQGYAADPHLKPEEMQAVEVGTQYQSPTLQAKASLYHHHGQNMIDWIMDTSEGSSAEWQSVNHTKINSYGLEASAMVDFSLLWPSQQVLRRLSLSYSYIDQDKVAEDHIVSQYALEYLKHKLLANLDLHLYKKLDLGLHLRWQDRVGTYTTFQNEVREYRPFALMDARLSWTEPRYSLYAEANNVFDNRDYVDYGNVPQPGRWLTFGLRYHF
ncbi:MAG: TonB-dependent receptor [Prevotella sp.]|nr:TonB-dependent receptor [Prevotella sp.]